MTSVTVPTAGNTELAVINIGGLQRIYFQFDTDQILDVFNINGRAHPSQVFQTFFSTSGDYTTPAGILVDASGDLTAAGAGSTNWFILDCAGIKQIQVEASALSVAATVVYEYSGFDGGT